MLLDFDMNHRMIERDASAMVFGGGQGCASASLLLLGRLADFDTVWCSGACGCVRLNVKMRLVLFLMKGCWRLGDVDG
jgi:hypothetical protein